MSEGIKTEFLDFFFFFFLVLFIFFLSLFLERRSQPLDTSVEIRCGVPRRGGVTVWRTRRRGYVSCVGCGI